MKKTFKKLMAALLAVALLCAMAVPAFAADVTHNSSSEDGEITINNAVNYTEYKIYRILDLQYNDNETTKSYRYVANNTWSGFVTSKPDYLTVNSTGDVTWKDGANIVTFAALAGQYAKENASTVHPVDTKTGNNNTVVFNNLPLGWYLVVSDLTTDSICSINTTDKKVVIKEKNSKPTIEKYVYRDGRGEYSNDAGIGDTVEFVINVAVLDGNPRDYVVHDKMSAGLTLDTNSVKVFRNRPIDESTFNDNALPTDDYELVTTDLTDGCTFEVRLKDTALQPNDMIIVKYNATINENAVIGVEGNDNDTYLGYDNNGKTEHSTTKTYVWGMGVHKYTGNVATALADAEFQLYKGESDSKQYAIFSTGTSATDGTLVHKLTGWTNNADDATTVKTPTNGNIKFEGLDAGTYYLEETAAPVGYNKLTEPIKVEINGTLPAKAGETVSYTVKANGVGTTNYTVNVENKAGATLPSTGGMGTTLFYVIGGGLMVAAVVLLVTKKRMENK